MLVVVCNHTITLWHVAYRYMFTHSYAFPVFIPQTSLEDDLNAMELSMSQALQVADAQKCTMREQLLDEMASYKVKHFPQTRWGMHTLSVQHHYG